MATAAALATDPGSGPGAVPVPSLGAAPRPGDPFGADVALPDPAAVGSPVWLAGLRAAVGRHQVIVLRAEAPAVAVARLLAGALGGEASPSPDPDPRADRAGSRFAGWAVAGRGSERVPRLVVAAGPAGPEQAITDFASTRLALQAASPAFARFLARLRVVDDGVPGGAGAPVAHPLVLPGPRGPSLLLPPGGPAVVEGFTRPASRELLDHLAGQIVRPEHLVRVRWEPGLIVVWDNWAVWHHPVIPGSARPGGGAGPRFAAWAEVDAQVPGGGGADA